MNKIHNIFVIPFHIDAIDWWNFLYFSGGASSLGVVDCDIHWNIQNGFTSGVTNIDYLFMSHCPVWHRQSGTLWDGNNLKNGKKNNRTEVINHLSTHIFLLTMAEYISCNFKTVDGGYEHNDTDSISHSETASKYLRVSCLVSVIEC